MSEKSFEEILRSKTENFYPVPRPGLWESVEGGLYPKKKNKRILIVFLTSAFILLSAVAVYFNVQNLGNQSAKSKANTIGPDSEKGYSFNLHKPLKDAGVKTIDANLPTRLNNQNAKKSPHHSKINSKINPTPSNTLSQDALGILAAKSDQIADVVIESESLRKDLLIDKTDSPIGPDSLSPMADVAANIDSSITPEINPIKSPIKSSGFFVEFYFNPGKMNPKVSVSPAFKTVQPYQLEAKDRNTQEKGLYSFSLGVCGGIESGLNRFGFGLQYLHLEYQMPVKNINEAILRGAAGIAKFDYNATDSFKFESEKNGGSNIRFRYQYVSLPLFYSRNILSKKKFSCFLNTNLSFNFLIHHQGLLNQNESGLYVKPETAPENHVMKMNLSAGFGPVFSYKLNPKIYFIMRPCFQYALTPLENSRLRTSYTFWSIGTGLQFFLK